jgi:hypothetical protein
MHIAVTGSGHAGGDMRDAPSIAIIQAIMTPMPRAAEQGHAIFAALHRPPLILSREIADERSDT